MGHTGNYGKYRGNCLWPERINKGGENMHKKARKIVSILLVAFMLLSSTGAFAFSFDDYDSEAGDRFVADYYANKESYYQTDNMVARFPAYAQPHKLYTDAEMQNEGINNFIPVVSSEIGTQIQNAGRR